MILTLPTGRECAASGDFLTGDPISPGLAAPSLPPHHHEQLPPLTPPQRSQANTPLALRTSTRQPPADTSDLRAQLNTVRYELETIKQERELEQLRHQDELQKLTRSVETVSKEKEKVETDKRLLFEKHKAATEELTKVKKKNQQDKTALEMKVRNLTNDNRTLAETLEERQSELSELERNVRRDSSQKDMQITTLTQSLNELREDFDSKLQALEETQRRLSECEVQKEAFEKELVTVKASLGDVETLGTVKRELKEQVEHIRTLEQQNRKYKEEIGGLREFKKSLDMVEEEKMELQSKVRNLENIRDKLAQAEVQIEIFEEQRKEWNAFLQDENMEFQTPVELARALMNERVEHAALLEKQGRVQPELAEKNMFVEQLETAMNELQKKLKATEEELRKANESKARIERSRMLAAKESEFLREQLKSFSAEEAMMEPDHDRAKDERISELERMLTEYKQETERLLAAIKSLEATRGQSSPGLKRAREDADDERVGELTRKLRSLQSELEHLQTTNTKLQRELSAQAQQINSQSQIRVLQLKDNPQAIHERTKAADIQLLREENSALRAQLLGSHPAPPSVPRKTVEVLRKEIAALEATIAEKEKRTSRLKTIWTKKSLEFRQAVHSVLGVLFDFLPNGKVRVSSSTWSDDDNDNITFDGEMGTMKIQGEAFRRRIQPLVEYWVEERKEIPGLVAALVLDGWERQQGEQTENWG